MNIGQICMAPDYVLVFKDAKDAFVRAARKWLAGNFTEHPKKSPAYSRMINATHCHRLMHLLEKTKGKILYKAADECDVLDRYVGPYLIEVEPEDILMEDEVWLSTNQLSIPFADLRPNHPSSNSRFPDRGNRLYQPARAPPLRLHIHRRSKGI